MNENEPEPTGKAVMPTNLSAKAQEYWKRYAPVLEPIGVLTSADADTFGACCESLATYWDVQMELNASAAGYDFAGRKNPLCTVLHEAFSRMMKSCAEFGMTPASRTGIVAPKPGTREPSLESFSASKPTPDTKGLKLAK